MLEILWDVQILNIFSSVLDYSVISPVNREFPILQLFPSKIPCKCVEDLQFSKSLSLFFTFFYLLFASRHSSCSFAMCRGSLQENASCAGAQRPQVQSLWGPEGSAILREAGPGHLLPSQLPHTWKLFHGILFLIFYL